MGYREVLKSYKCMECEKRFDSLMTYDYDKHIVVCCSACYFKYSNKLRKNEI